ncbi:MAG: hypothetical protein PHF25_08000 [Candidatus Margulisbacteria bacterium]|nr:hypothetical protein [Candidatus Margulisiibacteriota bacterium]
MKSDGIKNKLESFISEYQEKLGTFNGSLVIYDFVEFIKTEPAIKAIMKDQFAYFESQKDIIVKMTDDEFDDHLSNKVAFDPENPNTWPSKDVFTKEHNIASAIIKDSRPFSPIELQLPVSLGYLAIIHEAVSKAKEETKDNPDKSKEITQVIKELSTTSLPFRYKDKNEEKSLSLILPVYCLNCLAVVSSYIFSELDAKEFLKGNKPNPPITFDKDDSLLIINGTRIKISRLADRSIDHYILEAIFENEDISEEVYFKDVAKRMDEFADYDKTKDWRKFYRACEHLNQKIQTDTDNRVIGFIESHTGTKAWCKINPNYLKY